MHVVLLSPFFKENKLNLVTMAITEQTASKLTWVLAKNAKSLKKAT